MENITAEQVVIFGVIALAFFTWQKKRPDSEGRLPDAAVTREKVLGVLREFKVKRKSDGSSFRESDIHKQLLKFLQDRFYHVQSQKPIGGVHAKQIDFDIGRERVGIEIKMAKSLYKKSEFDRLHGQMKSYSEAYSDSNLILQVFGTKAELRDRVKQTAIIETLEDYPVHAEFIKIPK